MILRFLVLKILFIAYSTGGGHDEKKVDKGVDNHATSTSHDAHSEKHADSHTDHH